MGGGSSQYGDAYSERIGRSNIGGYGSSRSSMTATSAARACRMVEALTVVVRVCIHQGYGGDYISHGGDVGGSYYSSSLYSGRSIGGSGGYIGGGIVIEA